MTNRFGIQLFICLLAMVSSLQLNAQDRPAASPLGKVYQRVGVTDIEITYSRPGVKDRTIFAEDGLVPYGKLWRTGANAATKISFSTDVMIGGKKVPAGDYGVYSIPGAKEWTVIFNSEQTSANNYDKSKDVARVTVEVREMPFSVETMTFGFRDVKPTSAGLSLIWEKTNVVVPITVEKTWE